MILVFTVDKQIITRRDNEKVVRDSVNYLHVNFSFSEEWTGDKTAVFKSKSGIAYNVLVGSDGSCLVPWEVLKEEYFEVSAFCGDLITANVVKVFTIPSGYEIGSQGRIPTPDIYTQIIARLSAIEAEIDPTAIQQIVDEYLSDKDYVTEQDVEQIVADYIEAHKDELKGDTGETGPQGPQGVQGPKGDTGEGVAAGGTTGQVLIKSSNANYDTEWGNISGELPIATVTRFEELEFNPYMGGSVSGWNNGSCDVSCPVRYSGIWIPYHLSNMATFASAKIIIKNPSQPTSLNIFIGKTYNSPLTIKSVTPTADITYAVDLLQALTAKGLDEINYIFVTSNQATPCTFSISFEISSSEDNTTVSSLKNTLRGVQERIEYDIEGLKPLNGKKIIFLGDSITILLGNSNWTRQLCTMTGAEFVANVAVGGATLADDENTVLDGAPAFGQNNTLSNQVQKIINNQYTAPDIIVIAIGTNDGVTADATRMENSYYLNGAKVALADVDRTHAEGAFRYCNETLHNLYPNAIICWCNPIPRVRQNNWQDYELTESYANAYAKLTAYGSANNITTNRCGIHLANESGGVHEYLEDGTHPTAEGHTLIAKYNAAAIIELFA